MTGEQKHTKQVHLRFSPLELRGIARDARQHGLSVGQWLRFLAISATHTEQKQISQPSQAKPKTKHEQTHTALAPLPEADHDKVLRWRAHLESRYIDAPSAFNQVLANTLDANDWDLPAKIAARWNLADNATATECIRLAATVLASRMPPADRAKHLLA